MKILRYQNSPIFNPAAGFTALRHEVDRLFDAAIPAVSNLQNGKLFHELNGDFPVNLYDEKNSYIVRAEIPGFRKEELSVDVTEGVLTITGHHKEEKKTPPKAHASAKDKQVEDQVVIEERRVSRSISLPEHLKIDGIHAVYENGILTVKLPKKEEVRPKQINVEVK